MLEKEGCLNFICGGKTGDFIHCMMVIKLLCEKNNKKANLYITNDIKYGGAYFTFGVEKTFDDLKVLVNSQDYINSFYILKNDISHLNPINLNIHRGSNLLYKDCWINILLDMWNLEYKEGLWLKFNKKNEYSDKIIIHRSTQRHSNIFPWEKITKNNECLFITNPESIIEYETFPFRNNVKLHVCNSFSEMVEIINSCKIFIGNMSTPLALAHNLQIPHLAELIHLDDVHYIGDEKYLNNFFYIKSELSRHEGLNKLDGIEDFLVL